MQPLITMGLRTLAHLGGKEVFYQQIDSDTIDARPRFKKAHINHLSQTFALGVLSSHSIPRIQAIINHIGLTNYFPVEHLISSDGKDRKDARNWIVWRSQLQERGIALHTVVDIGEVLLQNLTQEPSFNSIHKYCITEDKRKIIEGVSCITGLDQMEIYGKVSHF